MNTANYSSQALSSPRNIKAQPSLFVTFGQWLQRARTRRQLSELPAYLLKDIGLNEADRYRETSKPFWQQ